MKSAEAWTHAIQGGGFREPFEHRPVPRLIHRPARRRLVALSKDGDHARAQTQRSHEADSGNLDAECGPVRESIPQSTYENTHQVG
ncbi:MAG: hypothetical protein O7D91_09330 [Planctomycetota bacterium]|nr:hypothetical protein [Planctomycetota bacterium]